MNNFEDISSDSVEVKEPEEVKVFPGTLNLLALPVEILEKIFSYMSYETISKIRLVCKQFNDISSPLLNSAFQRLQSLMLQRFQKIKSQMPRRESARRKHPLARESDIIETLHMRLTLLQMSFGKHIERKHCCFFAGEILDEVYRILHYVKQTPSLARAYKVTDELFDLSTMAMEYFKERIEPTLPEITYFGADFLEFNSFSSSSTKSCSWKILDSPSVSESPACSSAASSSVDDNTDRVRSSTTFKKKLNLYHQRMKRYERKQSSVQREVKCFRARFGDHEKQMKELSNRLEECNRKADESSRKFNAVLQELNKCKTELQYWRSKSPANQMCCMCAKTMQPLEESRPEGPPMIDLLEEPSLPEALFSHCHVSRATALNRDLEASCNSNFIPILDTEKIINDFEAASCSSKHCDGASPQTTPITTHAASSSAIDLLTPLCFAKRKLVTDGEICEEPESKRAKIIDLNAMEGDNEVARISAVFSDCPLSESLE